MSIDQQLIQKCIDEKQIITQCCVTGKVKVPGKPYYVGFRFSEPYDNISHSMCREIFETKLYVLRRWRY